ncbi:GDYXXLXY domain-containing protein [Candidatus Gracilibacteria bacterium]|nr:GDYXXLXY domain-containing protein [Candidatus Gracilibacteria bacterium]
MNQIKKPTQFKLFIGFILIFLTALGIFIGIQESILQKGEILFLESAPVDPRDLLRGDYVILRYVFENDSMIQNYIEENDIDKGTDLYVSFNTINGDLGVIKSVSRSFPNEGIFLRVTTTGEKGWQSPIETHIGKYFVPEGTGGEIERIRSDMTIKLRVNTKGVARIVDLYYRGERIIPGEFRLN